MNKNGKIFVAGASGMVGSAIIRALFQQGYSNIIGSYHSRKPEAFNSSLITDHSSLKPIRLDLTDQQAVHDFFGQESPEYVIIAAAKVGGIHANDTYPADFIYQNMMIEANLIHHAYKAGVKRLLFLGSSCIYPKMATQPMAEDALLTGTLEPTNEPYALSKIAGIKLCESYNRQHGTDFRSVMPTNLYGENDNFHPENSHVVPAMMRRFHEAKMAGQESVTVWGTGNPKREFLHVDDMAAASVHVLTVDKSLHDAITAPMCSHLNVGTGQDCTIRELAETMAEVVGFTGRIQFDSSKPDGTPRKLLDVSKLSQLGWRASISLKNGLQRTYAWYLENVHNVRR